VLKIEKELYEKSCDLTISSLSVTMLNGIMKTYIIIEGFTVKHAQLT